MGETRRLVADEADEGTRACVPRAQPRELWTAAVFVVLALAFCAPGLLPGRVMMPTNPARHPPWTHDPAVGDPADASNPLMGDTLIFTLPGRIWNHEMLRDGQIPFWNPHVFAGYPHLALIQNNALYPLSAPFDVLDPWSSLALSALVHFSLAGILMYAFLRRAGLGVAAALVGGAAFELNGMFLVRVSAPSYVYSGIWLPLVLLGAHAIVERPLLRRGWPVVVGTAMSVLGGHPQITSLVLLLSGLYLLFLLAEELRRVAAHRARHAATALLVFGACVVLGVGLTGYQLVPFAELVAHSGRTIVPLEVYRSAALPFPGVLQAFLPDVFGNPVEDTYWFAWKAPLVDGVGPRGRFWGINYTGANVYTGIAPLVLAMIAVARSERRAVTLFFATVAVASIAVLVGTPLLDLVYFAIPGFRYSRPDRILYLYMASLSVLSALGVEALYPRDGNGATARTRWHAVVLLAAALVVGVAWQAMPRMLAPDTRAALVQWCSEAIGYWREQSPILLPQAVFLTVVLLACLALAASATRRALRSRSPAALRGWVAAWLLLVALPNLAFGWKFNPVQARPTFGGTETERLLRSHAREGRIARVGRGGILPANVTQVLDLQDVNGASAAGVGNYIGLIAAADPKAVSKMKYFRAFRDPEVVHGPLLDVLNVAFVLSDEDLSGVLPEVATREGVQVLRNPGVLPRFRVVTAYEAIDDDAAVRARVVSRDFDAKGRAVVSSAAAAELERLRPARGTGRPSRAEVERDEPHALRLHVTAPNGGLLVVADVHYPGWQARVDGERREVIRVNGAFRGVALEPGEHVVEMTFVPRSFHAGLLLSLASLVVAAAIWRPRAERRAARS